MKKLAAILIGLVVVLTGISLAPQFLLDQNHLRQRVTTAFQRQTGLELKMGETSFQLLPWPSFQATNVVLTRPGCTPFVAARSVHADLSMLAVLRREISFQDFTVSGAGVMLHRASEAQCSTWLPMLSQGQDGTAALPVSAPASAAGQPGGKAAASQPRWKISFGALHLDDSELSWQDDLSDGHVPAGGHIHIDSLELVGMRSASPWVDLRGTHGHTGFTLRGRVGPLRRLLSARAEQKEPWAFSLGVTLGEGSQQDHATLDGTMGDAHRLRHVAFTLQGHWASLRGMKHFFPRFALPEMEQVEGMIRFHSEDGTGGDGSASPASGGDGTDVGTVAGTGAADMALTDALLHLPGRLVPDQAHVHLGLVDLPAGAWHIAAPLQLRDIQMDAKQAGAPLVVQGQAVWGRYFWLFHGEMESMRQALVAGFGNPALPVGVKMDVQGQDRTLPSLFNRDDAGRNEAAQDHVSFSLQGQVGRTGSALALQGQAALLQLPDIGGLSGLLVHDGHVKGRLAIGPLERRGPSSFTVEDMAFDSQEFGGSLSASLPAPLGSGLKGQLHLTHLEGDRFTYAPVMEIAGASTAPVLPSLAVGAALHTADKAASPGASAGKGDGRSEADRYAGSQYAGSHGNAEGPDHQSPSRGDETALGALAGGKESPVVQWLGDMAIMPLDVDLTADHLQAGGVGYQGLHLHLLGLEGRLALSVLGGMVQSVPLSGTVVLDGSVAPMRLGMKAEPLILPASWVQRALNQPVTFEGPVQLDGSLATEGAHPGALLQTLEGRMGLSLVGGQVHREALAPLAGPAASLLKLGSGTMGLRCVASTVRFDHGQARFGDMALEVKHLSVLGQGVMTLGDLRYSFQLLPHVTVAGADFSTPLVLAGQNGAFHIGSAGRDGMPELPALNPAAFGDDACNHAVQQARSGHAGLSLPVREQGHSGGAGGILRALGL